MSAEIRIRQWPVTGRRTVFIAHPLKAAVRLHHKTNCDVRGN